jgi:hypothetical protein
MNLPARWTGGGAERNLSPPPAQRFEEMMSERIRTNKRGETGGGVESNLGSSFPFFPFFDETCCFPKGLPAYDHGKRTHI